MPAAAIASAPPASAPPATVPPATAAPAIAPAAGVPVGVRPPHATGAATPAPASAPASVKPAATPSGPQILSISTSPQVVHDGESVVWDVRTTPDVVSVTAHVAAYNLPLVRQAAGRFGLSFAVPSNVPGFFHGTYNLDVTARSGTGATADRAVSVTFE